MRRLLVPTFALGVLILTPVAAAAAPQRPHPDEGPRPTPATILSYDYAQRVDVNQVSMSVTNYGTFAWDLATFGPGLEFPRGSGKTAVFAGGLWLGATVGGDVRVTVAEYSQEYQPGAMMGAAPDDPIAPQYKVYKLHRSYPSPAERDAALADYGAGAVPYGAPPVSVLPDGTLDITGDQVLWSVFNDAEPSAHTNNAGATLPLGVEVRQTTFAFDRPGPLGRVIYLRYQLVNKGPHLLENMYVGLWMDPDIGGFTDDLVGCSPSRSMGFCYNVGGSDLQYGAMPPAIGVDLIQGPQGDFGARLGLTAFSNYINGTDPNSPFESYNYMQGLLPDGSLLVDPTTGIPTAYFHASDPIAGTGWLDLLGSDKRMLLSSGPFTMAPGQQQEVLYALILGLEDSHLTSLARVLCDEPGVQAFAEAGFTGPGPVTGPCPVPAACPRTAADWEAQFDGGGDFTLQELQALASCMDETSTLLELSGSVDAVRGLLDSGNLADPAGTARRQYATLLANACATTLRLPAAAPVSLRLADGVSCPGLAATSVGQLLETAEIGLQAEYLNLNPANRRALAGVDWGGPGFSGGAGAMWDFFGTGPDPHADPQAFPTVEIRFDHAQTQLAYRYLRLEQQDGLPPEVGRAYRYGGFHPVNFTCWDVTHGVQLDVAFVERAVTDPFGNLLDPAFQPPTHDFTWRPDDSEVGGREYLFVTNRPYTGSPAFDLEQDGVPVEGPPVFLYALWSRLRSPFDVIDDGDQFRFAFDYPPGPGVDVNLILLARQPQQDPAVLAAYADIAACLHGVNAPDAGCGPAGPILANAGADVRVECSSHEGTPVRLDGRLSEGTDLAFSWSAQGITFDDPTSTTPTGRFPLGTTTVTLMVSRGGEISTDEVVVTVVDTQAPSLTVALTPAFLWPPNHALADIHASVEAEDACDGAPRVTLTSITSDEPDGGLDAEDVPGDVQEANLGVADFDFRLRSERGAEGDGRTYTVCYETRDASGNAATACATVQVPHDRRGRASLATADGTWRLTLLGGGNAPARSIETGTIVVGTSGFDRVPAAPSPPVYSDMNGDREDDVMVVLTEGLAAAQLAAGPLFARWIAAGIGYQAEIAPGSVTDVPPGGDLPLAFAAGAWPNPARGQALIFYALPREGRVRVRVFDVGGREVGRLVDGWVPAGRHSVSFAPGKTQLYIYRVEWEGRSVSGRIAAIR